MTEVVGIVVGWEDTFPSAFIDRVNQHSGVRAELAKFGGIREDHQRHYAVLVDRLSHQIPFYRMALKAQVLAGTYVINDPFWWSADDKFFGYSAGRSEARRRRPAYGDAAAEATTSPAIDKQSQLAQPGIPARLGGDRRVRRLPGDPEARRRRRLART